MIRARLDQSHRSDRCERAALSVSMSRRGYATRLACVSRAGGSAHVAPPRVPGARAARDRCASARLEPTRVRAEACVAARLRERRARSGGPASRRQRRSSRTRPMVRCGCQAPALSGEARGARARPSTPRLQPRGPRARPPRRRPRGCAAARGRGTRRDRGASA